MNATTVQTEIKERPILFSGPMVRAILEGRKTQTRRAIKTKPGEEFCDLNGYGNAVFTADNQTYREVTNPYGGEGDRLWVRETLIKCQDSELSTPLALYKTGRQQVLYYGEPAEWTYRHDTRPGIHMPRWASRLTLEITGVRVERLQDITEADVKAEGFTYLAYRCAEEMEPCDPGEFSDGWDSINAKRGYAWSTNPWVWVLTFRKT